MAGHLQPLTCPDFAVGQWECQLSSDPRYASAAFSAFADVDMSRREGEPILPIDRMPEPLRKAARKWLDEQVSLDTRRAYLKGLLAMSVWLSGRIGRSDLLMFDELTPELLEQYDQALIRGGSSHSLRTRDYHATKSFVQWLPRYMAMAGINSFAAFRPQKTLKGHKSIEEATRDYQEILSRIPMDMRADLEAWGATVSRAKTRTLYLSDCMAMLEAIMKTTGQGYGRDVFSSVDSDCISAISEALSLTCAPTTIDRRWASTRSFVRYLAGEEPSRDFGEILTFKDAAQKPRQTTKVASLEDVLGALDVAIATGFYKEGWVADRDRAILHVIGDCGAKAIEISKLNVKHFEDARRNGCELLVPGRSYTCKISLSTIQAIEEYLLSTPRLRFSDDALFLSLRDRRIDPAIIQRHIRHLADAAGLDSSITVLGLVADHIVREFQRGIPETVIARRLDINVSSIAETLQRAGCFESWGVHPDPQR